MRFMNKKLVIAVILFITTIMQGVAKPATPHPIAYTQPDGTIITVKLCGDEYYHYYTTESGRFVTLCDDGYFRYTTLDNDNTPTAGETIVGEVASYGMPSEQASIVASHRAMYKERRNLKQTATQIRHATMLKVAEKAQSSDKEVKGLVLLVNFSDKSFQTPQSTINDMMNKEGYTDDYGSIGSARDYFIDQSYGQFRPTFDVIGPVTLKRNMSYYGKNDSYGQDSYPDLMVSEACEAASSEGLVDMSDYDLDGDGWVDLVYVIYAGYAESSGAASNTIWPHAWYIYQGAGRTVEVDGVCLDAYACSSELNGTSGSDVDGIGTFVHEYSHTLGLPDFYDIDYSGGMGMDYWSVMDSGCYGEDGYIPINYNAYERAFCGWITFNELAAPTSITMPELHSDRTAAYRISSTDDNQYITLETRKREGWDKSLESEGMMVVAIDYDAKIWEDNAPNDSPSRQRVRLIPADNKWDTSTLYGDLYPYGSNNELTSTSSPAMKVYNTTIYDKPITNIEYNDGVTMFDFMGGKAGNLNTPVATSAGEVKSNSFTAYWSPVEGATSYTLYVERYEEEETPELPIVAFEENFDKFTDSSSKDISTLLDDYTTVAGWSGYKVFCNDGEVKLGSSSNSGSLSTPTVDVGTECIVYFDASSYNSDAESGTLTVTLENATAKGTCEIPMSDLPYDEITTIGIRCDCGDADTKFIFDCSKRIYLDNIRIENVTEENSTAQQACRSMQTTDRGDTVGTTVRKASTVTESRTIEGITDTYYTVTQVENIVSPGLYRYKVKAVAEGEESYWSNVIDVIISSNSDIEGNRSVQGHVYALNDNIHITGYNNVPVTIYNLQGSVVAHFESRGESIIYNVSTAGMYIVRCGNDVTKVLVK